MLKRKKLRGGIEITCLCTIRSAKLMLQIKKQERGRGLGSARNQREADRGEDCEEWRWRWEEGDEDAGRGSWTEKRGAAGDVGCRTRGRRCRLTQIHQWASPWGWGGRRQIRPPCTAATTGRHQARAAPSTPAHERALAPVPAWGSRRRAAARAVRGHWGIWGSGEREAADERRLRRWRRTPAHARLQRWRWIWGGGEGREREKGVECGRTGERRRPGGGPGNGGARVCVERVFISMERD